MLVPARNGSALSLTASSAAASRSGLIALLVLTVIGIPLMLGYTMVVYRLFRGRSTTEGGDRSDGGGY